MDLSQVRHGGSAKHLRWSSVALCLSEPPVWSRFWTIWRFPDQRGSATVCEMVRKRDQTDGSGKTKGSHYGVTG